MSLKTCSICNAATLPFSAQYLKSQRDLCICPDCRHIQWQVFPTPDEIASFYESQYASAHGQTDLQEQGRTYYRTHADELLERYASFGGTKTRPVLVDFGCAWPVFLEEAQKSGYYTQLIGVDYDENTIKAGAALGITMMTPDDFFAHQPLESIDIIRFSHVLEHLVDPVALMRKLYPLMARNGVVYVTQPAFPMLKTNAVPPTIQDATYPEHLHFYNALSLSRLLQDEGFTLVKIAAFQKETEMEAAMADSFDESYAREKLVHTKDLTDKIFQGLGSYPSFYGENMFAYAVKGSAGGLLPKIKGVWRKIRRKLR